MKLKMILSGTIAILFPFLLLIGLHDERKDYRCTRILLLAFYTAGILYFTLFRESVSNASNINLTPFWSYAFFRHADIRWQVYMNVFLFVPYGFLLLWAAKKNYLQAFLISIALSTCIEAVQYFFRLGLCEFDDVFHNTLGAVLGYGYCKLLVWIDQCYGDKIRMGTRRLILQRLDTAIKTYHRVKNEVHDWCNK